MIDKAIRTAAAAHKDTFRKGNRQPYIFHPIEVLSLVSMMTDDDEVLCAAVLHDTVEDTGMSLKDIEREFSPRVAKLVSLESEDKRGNLNKADTWKDRKQETIDTISGVTDEGALMVCLADKVSNLRSMHMGLMDRGEEFWNVFNQKDPLMHHWYFSELKKALSPLKEQAVYKEYCFLIDAIFGKYLGKDDGK